MMGEPWIDRAMVPLSSHHLGTDNYNAIYEAVSRGTPEQGARLVRAIVSILAKAEKKATA